MKNRTQFEDRVHETVRTILGRDAPRLEVIRNPRIEATGYGRGRKHPFHGLDTPQCEEIKLKSRREGTTPLTSFGVHLVAYHHRDCREGVFAGDFASYVIGYLHRHHPIAMPSSETVAVLYGLDPATVAKASGIYRARRHAGISQKLPGAFADDSIGRLIASHEEGRVRFEAVRQSYLGAH